MVVREPHNNDANILLSAVRSGVTISYGFGEFSLGGVFPRLAAPDEEDDGSPVSACSFLFHHSRARGGSGREGLRAKRRDRDRRPAAQPAGRMER